MGLSKYNLGYFHSKISTNKFFVCLLVCLFVCLFVCFILFKMFHSYQWSTCEKFRQPCLDSIDFRNERKKKSFLIFPLLTLPNFSSQNFDQKSFSFFESILLRQDPVRPILEVSADFGRRPRNGLVLQDLLIFGTKLISHHDCSVRV